MSIRKPHAFSTNDETWDKVVQEATETGRTMSAIINEALFEHFQTRHRRSAWSVDDEAAWYDERKFFTFTEDKHGHSAKVVMNVPKTLAGLIQTLVSSGKIPELKSPQDFYRSALFHYAHKVGRWVDEGELVESVSVAMMQADLEAVVQAARDVDALVDSLRAAFDLALSNEDMLPWAEAKLKELWSRIGSISELFKKDFIKVLVAYGDRLKAMRGGKIAEVHQYLEHH